MSEADWDSVTRIGRKARPTGENAAEKERVVKGRSALNAAQRSGGVIATEKKWGGANSGSQGEGQHLTKVDRSDDIVKPKTVGLAVAAAIKKGREELKLNQKDLAAKISVPPATVQQYETGNAQPDQKVLSAMERVLKVKLRGQGIGEPTKFAKKAAS